MSTPQQAVLRRKKMRGGLGRTLLTAFLLLALGPLSAMSVYAISRTNAESNRQQEELVALLAESYRAQIMIASQNLALALEQEEVLPQWVLNKDGNLLDVSVTKALPTWLDQSRKLTQWQVGGSPPALWVAVPRNQGVVASILPLESIVMTLERPPSLQGTELYIQQGTQIVPVSPDAIPLTGPEVDNISFVRRELNDLTLLLMLPMEQQNQAQQELATTLVAAALVAALITTIAAAFITRQITRPIYDLTQAVVKIARGEIKQRVQVKRENELGILALAFNTMANRLHETLETLEERVEQRTEALRQANAEIAARARQLELTAEIGATISNIHNMEQLLKQGIILISDSFAYQDVAIWLLGRRPGRDPGLTLRISTQTLTTSNKLLPSSENGHSSVSEQLAQQALQSGNPVFDEQKQCVALPLRLADNVFGSMVLTHPKQFKDGIVQQQHLQILADSLAVAIENARASEMERAALDKLQQLEQHRSLFLGEMSHELSTALNSIIGFSRLMLKEIEGPLTDTQRSDLTYINRNGMHLLSLLDGLLEVIDKEPELKFPFSR